MMYKRSGYILTLTLTLTFLVMFLVVYIANRAMVFAPYAHIAIEQKQAYLLAQSGIQLAISQIMAPKIKKQKTEQEHGKNKKPNKEDQLKDMLTVVLPSLNKWQAVHFKESVEGIDADISFCITSEQGKIDLNAFYDFTKHEFINGKETEKLFKALFERIQKSSEGKDLFAVFKSILKARKQPFNDPTELLTKEFAMFKDKLFYVPSADKTTTNTVYLTDLFTVWTGKRSVNPWLFSESLAIIMGLTGENAKNAEERHKMVAQWLKPFKLNNTWPVDWNKILKPVYGKEFNSIPKDLQPLLSSTFEADLFSVLSYATVGRVTVRLLAIVACPVDGQSDDIIMKKVYWL